MSSPRPTKVPRSVLLARMGGVFLLLLSLFLLLAPASRFYGVGYLTLFFLGIGSYLSVPAFLFAKGIALFAKEKKGNARLPLPFVLGTVFLSIGLSFLFGAAENPSWNGEVTPFLEAFWKAGETRFGCYFAPETQMGLLGYLVSGPLSSGNLAFVTILLCSFFLVFALVSYSSPLLGKLFASLRSRRAIAKARKESETEEVEEESEEDTPSFLRPTPPTMPLEEEKEVFVFPSPSEPEPEEEESETPPEEEVPPAPTPTFVRASNAPYRSTETVRLQHPESPRYSPLPEVSPLPPAYRDDLPPRHIGLVPAYQSLHLTAEQPSSSFAEVSVPSSPTIPAPSLPNETPSPKVVEEEPFDFAPDFAIEEKGKEEITEEETPMEEDTPKEPLAPLPLPEEPKETAPTIPSLAVPTPSVSPAPAVIPTPFAPQPTFLPPEETVFAYVPFKGYGEIAKAYPYTFPSLDLTEPKSSESEETEAILKEECDRTSHVIDAFFVEFGLDVKVVDYSIGPSITLYEIKPGPGIPLANITRIIPNLDRKLFGVYSRFSDRVVGTDNYAVEVPNSTRRTVPFREIMEQLSTKSPLMIPFGIDIKNKLVQGDLRKFPHMLVCGATGSGKSIFMHAIICALLMRNSPETLRLILVDPKGTETTMYRKDPHLACPVISDVTEAGNALQRLVDEMEERNKIFQEAEVRDVESYNGYYCKEHNLPPMPYLVCIVDELADLVETQKEKVTSPILRLASKARSAGIHLIIATQRPDTKVISGTIKANFTTRVALKVQSTIDSQTILGQGGAETLLKYGDMLISSGEISSQGFTRAQGCLIEVSEMHRIVNDAASKRPQQFFERFLHLEESEEEEASGGEESSGPINVDGMSEESIYRRIREYAMSEETISISKIIAAFNVGYPRASKLFRRLQEEGIVGPSRGNNAKGCVVLRHDLDEIDEPTNKLVLPGEDK